MRKAIRILFAVASLLSAAALILCISAQSALPDEFTVVNGQKLTLNSLYQISKISNSASQQTVDMKTSVTTENQGNYDVEIKILGVVPVKSAKVVLAEEKTVVPCGTPFGVKMFTSGVMIIGLTDVDTANGPVNPAQNAGLKMGDIILSINGDAVNTNAQVAKAFENSGGKAAAVKVKRGDSTFTVQLEPALSASIGRYKAGLWVRDSTAGIGTLTYYDTSNSVFGALGHGICDVDTGELLPLLSGEIVSAQIDGVICGTSGCPGELQGTLSGSDIIGNISQNTQVGIFGKLFQPPSASKEYPVAMKQEIKKGPAQIISTIDGNVPHKYDIKIVRIYYNSKSVQKNMVIEVTDPDLIKTTGGIVQGMSGSPIIQDGKFVGAVTHVFVDNPKQGYAIFAENMVYASDTVAEQDQKQAS